jgi:hypothetical protein
MLLGQEKGQPTVELPLGSLLNQFLARRPSLDFFDALEKKDEIRRIGIRL